MPVAAPALRTVGVKDFSGGPNLRDAQGELAKNESVDSWIVTFDERGGVGSRLGYQKDNATAFGGGPVSNTYKSGLLGTKITQAGASLYLGTANVIRKTFTTAARVGLQDFAGKVFAIHPVDGMWSTTDGVTWTALADTDAPKGTSLAVWQNKLFANDSVNKSRLHWSSAGDGSVWSPTDINDLREKDDEQIVSLAGASGADILAQAGLCVFKLRSAYRVQDSATGSYVTIDSKVGAASAIAHVSVLGRIYTISEAGIYSTDGNSSMRNESPRFEPLWNQAQINIGQLDLFAAGTLNNRLHFSLPRAGSSVNDLAIEYHPELHWLAPGSNAMACYAYDPAAGKLYGGHPSTPGRVYEMYAGVGTDDGVAIDSRFQSRWFQLADGFEAQLWRARLQGRGSFTLTVLKDYAQSGGSATGIQIENASQLLYDTGLLYDSGLEYNTTFVQGIYDVLTPGLGRAFSFKVSASTSDTDFSPAMLGQGSGRTVGSWSLYGLDLSFVPFALA